jgi:hypothetical protein
LAPEERVTFVGKAPAAGMGQSGSQGKAKGQANTKARPQPKTVAAPAPQVSETPAPSAELLRSNRRGLHEAKNTKRMSCLDAAAKLLSETGQPMTCQELIAAMIAKGYWKSPAGKTPQASLYAAIVRELRAKQDRARFRKTAPGRFARA